MGIEEKEACVACDDAVVGRFTLTAYRWRSRRRGWQSDQYDQLASELIDSLFLLRRQGTFSNDADLLEHFERMVASR